MNNCMTCGGLIMEPGIAYGYSGPVCHCIASPKYQKPMNQQSFGSSSQGGLTNQYIYDIVNKILGTLVRIEEKLNK
jgi:hypothetical protein